MAGVRRVAGDARSAVFAPLDQLGRVETVARRLTDAITLGLLADQEQLPSESDLASRFGVSTVTVREALMALRQQGLVETRRGRSGGSFVRTPRDAGAASLRQRLAGMTMADIRDIGDHYLAIAGAAAKLAAERASDEDVTRMRQAADGSARTKTDQSRAEVALHRIERGFHLEVAAASQSPRLTQAEVRLQGEIGPLLWLPAADDGREAADAHEAIVAAVAAGDGETARALTEAHVGEAVERLGETHLRMLEE